MHARLCHGLPPPAQAPAAHPPPRRGAAGFGRRRDPAHGRARRQGARPAVGRGHAVQGGGEGARHHCAEGEVGLRHLARCGGAEVSAARRGERPRGQALGEELGARPLRQAQGPTPDGGADPRAGGSPRQAPALQEGGWQEGGPCLWKTGLLPSAAHGAGVAGVTDDTLGKLRSAAGLPVGAPPGPSGVAVFLATQRAKERDPIYAVTCDLVLRYASWVWDQRASLARLRHAWVEATARLVAQPCWA